MENYTGKSLIIKLPHPYRVNRQGKSADIYSVGIRRIKNTDLSKLSALSNANKVSGKHFLNIAIKVSQIVCEKFFDESGNEVTGIPISYLHNVMPASNATIIALKAFNFTRGHAYLSCSYKLSCEHVSVFDLNPFEPVPANIENNRGYKRNSDEWLTILSADINKNTFSINFSIPYEAAGVPEIDPDTGAKVPNTIQVHRMLIGIPTVADYVKVFDDPTMSADPDLWICYQNIRSINDLPEAESLQIRNANGNGDNGILAFPPRYRAQMVQGLSLAGVEFNMDRVECLECGKVEFTNPDMTNFLDFLT